MTLDSWKPKKMKSLKSIFKNSRIEPLKYTKTISKWVDIISEEGNEVDISEQDGMVFLTGVPIISNTFQKTEEVIEYMDVSENIKISNNPIIENKVTRESVISSGRWLDISLWDDISLWVD